MARTRGGRVRAAGGGGDDGGVSESTASESEVVIASSSAGEGSAIPSESDGEGLDKKTRRTSPRKRDTSVISNNDTIAAPQIASSSAASAARKRPFKPARSARKTTQSHSSAAKRRALEVFNASNNNNNNSNDTTSESDDELAITSSAAKRLAAPSSVMPFGNHRDISDSEEDEVHNEMALRAARFTSQRIANDMNATTTDEEEDEGDETIWVPVRSGSQIPSNGSTSLLSTSLKRKNPPSSSSSRNRDGSENGTPKPTIAGAPTLRQLAQKARIILENAMHDTSFHLSSQDKDTLSDFLGSMQPPNREASTEHDIRIERVLLDTFGLTIKQAGPEFSIVELIDILTYLVLFGDTDDAEVLRQGLPVALDNFSSSLLPLGLKLNINTLALHLQLRIQLVLARARVVGEILRKDNDDIMNEDEDLAVRFVDNGQEALWDEYQGKAARIMATILSGKADIDDLLAEYPYENFLAAFLKHVKRVLSHLKRPAIRPVSSTVASSPSKYHEHIARKRLKADQVRRQSAPPPQLSQMPPSPYQDLRGKIRQARKSSPVRRPPPTAAIFASPRKQGQLATSLRESRHDDDDDSDEEVENVLLTRSSAPLVSEQEDGPAIEEGQNQEIEFVQEEKGDNENESMVVEEEEEEITTETQVVETQVVGTQIVQKNLLDRSALGVFLETQAESQVDAQMEDSQEADIPPQENGDTPQMGEGSQDVGFWDNGMASAGGREAPMDADMDGYADLAQYADAAPSEQQHQQQEQEEEDSQASQALPGRSDAPSPSLANPQSFDDSLYDELAQDADVTFESANQFIGEEVDISQVPTPRAVVSATAESSREAGESSLGNVEEEDNVAASHVGANDTAENSLLETMAPPVESTPQAPPRRRGRPPKKKPNWFAKQHDAEKITMSSPAQNSEEGAAVKPVSRNTRAARKSTGPNVLTAAGDGEVNGQTNHPAADESLPPSAREAAQSSTPQLTGPRSRRKAFHYIETEEEQDEGSEDLESAVDVASTRRSARAKAAASNAAKGKGRARRIADPEQATSRVSLPTRKGRTGVEAARESSQISESDARREEVNGDEENELELDISARRLAQESQDEDIDELASSEPVQEDSNDSAPVASTSAAVHALPARRRTSRRSAASAAPSTSSSAPSRPSAPKASTSATKGKGKGKAIATSAAPSSPALPVASGDVAEDDTLNNDPEQLAEKRRLFAEAIKAHREGLEQSERFLEIKRRYNEISLIYPRYVDERASAVTTWDGSERKTFLVALDLMPNPLANRRFKSVLMDHGINGVVTRNLKNRKSSQLKDKGENIKHLHMNAPISNPAFAFFQNALDIDGTIVRKPQRRRKNARGQSIATDDDDQIEDFQDANEN